MTAAPNQSEPCTPISLVASLIDESQFRPSARISPPRPVQRSLLTASGRRETDIHRLDVLRRPLVSPGGVEVNGEVDHTVVMRRNPTESLAVKRAQDRPTESLAVKRAQDRLRRLCLRPQFQERRFIGRKAKAVRLSGYPSLRFFQFAQPVFQGHLSAPIVPAAAQTQQPRRPGAATSRDSRVCWRAWGPSSRPEYQPSLRPASALHLQPIRAP
jgi:hypothetical protein